MRTTTLNSKLVTPPQTGYQLRFIAMILVLMIIALPFSTIAQADWPEIKVQKYVRPPSPSFFQRSRRVTPPVRSDIRVAIPLNSSPPNIGLNNASKSVAKPDSKLANKANTKASSKANSKLASKMENKPASGADNRLDSRADNSVNDSVVAKPNTRPLIKPNNQLETISKEQLPNDENSLAFDKGPTIRIALANDVGVAQVSCSQPLNYYDGAANELVALDTQQVKIELGTVRERPGRTYRVQVASLKSSPEARKLESELRQDFNEPVSTKFDEQSQQYIVTIGEFSSSRDAQTFMVSVMNAGYKRPWVAKDEPPSQTNGYQEKLIKAVSITGSSLVAQPERLTLISPNELSAPLLYNGKAYRGRLELLLNKRGRLTVINTLPMEDYLRGVVPNELSPGGFPMIEALKAQAVAARTYAVRNLGQFEAEGYDLLPTALSQVYGGLTTENPLSDQAVAETKGLVATFEGKPINALYTSTCGGRTESAQFVFNEPVPYLVSVDCAPQKRERRVNPDSQPLSPKDRSSSTKDRLSKDERSSLENLPPHGFHTLRKSEPLINEQGRAISREITILSLLQFALPDNLASSYLQATASEKEIARWVDRASELLGRNRTTIPKDISSLAGFASYLNDALYGENSASKLLSAADADYLLASDAAELPARSRADVAALLKEGILMPTADGSLHVRDNLSRATVLLAISRALSKFNKPALDSGSARPLEGRRLKIKMAKGKDPVEFDINADCYLFRVLNNEAFPATTLEIIGGEKVTYHLDSRGRIDYLEVQPNANGAASDRFSVFSNWQVELTPEEVKARLVDARVAVGEIVDLQSTKFGLSHRVAELKVVGSQGERTISGLRIRSALGLRESLFIVQREYNTQGQVSLFRFVGRGWGHGVGMCQVGAYGLALEGLSYEDILKTYYTGINLTKQY